MTEHERKLRLAVAIGEWTSALDHMNALAILGDDLAAEMHISIAIERDYLCAIWLVEVRGDGPCTPDEVPKIVEEARAFATQHQAEIDALLETGVST